MQVGDKLREKRDPVAVANGIARQMSVPDLRSEWHQSGIRLRFNWEATETRSAG